MGNMIWGEMRLPNPSLYIVAMGQNDRTSKLAIDLIASHFTLL